MLDRKSLFFTYQGTVAVREEQLAAPGPGQVLVRSLLSAISTGTEMLLYRGQFPDDLALDESIDALQGSQSYPLKYGYSLVGEVIDMGEEVGSTWLGKKVFAFHPHESQFVANIDSLQIIPDEIKPHDAVFLPNMETAVNFLLDGSPLIGEKVVVLGQGVVGLLTTALLAQFPLESLLTVDRYPLRRQASLDLGATASLDPGDAENNHLSRLSLNGSSVHEGADLIYELTGEPGALNQAISMCGFHGRVVVGSWYGKKQARIDLGGWFHRSRIKLISSQVSSMNPEYSGRWDKTRRYQAAWGMIARIKPSKLITQSIPFEAADQAYRMLDQKPGESIQVVFEY
jgi:2-desacetyl-2-hydroxyethyl bacteriochlorophyllide A dehydrogenase